MDIQYLLGGGSVERVDSLSDTGSDSFRVVVVESCGNTSILVNLFGLGNDGVGVLVQFTRDSLVLSNDLVADSVVNAVEKVEEPARDTLLVCLSARWNSFCPGELTVKVDSSLDNVVTKNVAVSEVLGNDSGLRSVWDLASCRARLTAGLSS